MSDLVKLNARLTEVFEDALTDVNQALAGLRTALMMGSTKGDYHLNQEAINCLENWVKPKLIAYRRSYLAGVLREPLSTTMTKEIVRVMKETENATDKN